jgi:hypothetical protein
MRLATRISSYFSPARTRGFFVRAGRNHLARLRVVRQACARCPRAPAAPLAGSGVGSASPTCPGAVGLMPKLQSGFGLFGQNNAFVRASKEGAFKVSVVGLFGQ